MNEKTSQMAAEGDLRTIEQDLKIQGQKAEAPQQTKSSVKAIPEGHGGVVPYLAIKNAVKALDFYKRAFGAIEKSKLLMLDGRLGHAELQIGNSVIMVSEEFPEHGGKSPETLGGTPVNLHLYVQDVDAAFKKAIEAGAKQTSPVMDQFYGDRSGQLQDPFGHMWWLATHIEDVSDQELQKRLNAMGSSKNC